MIDKVPLRMSSATIIKAIGCKELKLYNGRGYWYFVYDGTRYYTHSVMVMRLSDMTFKQWVDEGRDFINHIGHEIQAKPAPVEIDPKKDFYGSHEIAKLANVTVAAVSNWMARDKGFPAPWMIFKMGPVFNGPEVRSWLKRNKGI